MKKNLINGFIVLLLIAFLTWFGLTLIKPRHNKVIQNPYALNLDSLTQIDPSKMGDYDHSVLPVPLEMPVAIAAATNHIVVSGDNKIIILDKTGQIARQFDTNSTAHALAVDHKGQIYAAFEKSIALYSEGGNLLKTFPVGDEKTYLTSIAVDKGATIYVADAGNGRVYAFNTAGSLVRTIGSTDKTDPVGYFLLPSNYFDVAIGLNNTLWVANTGRHKLVGFNPSGSLRAYWGEASSELEGFCGCCNPSHFVILKDGSFITAEKGIVRIKKYDPSGTFVCAIAGVNHFKQHNIAPDATGLDMAVTTEETLLVLEPGARMIHLFKDKIKTTHE